MRLLHIADTHLGARPKGIVEREGDLYEAFKEIIDIAIESNVDAVIHAGDMFHDTSLYPTPYIITVEELSRLKSRGIAFYAVAGNHDAAKPTRNSPLELLHRLGYIRLLSDDEKPGVVRLTGSSGIEIEIHGYSYKASDRLLASSMNPPRYSVLLAHIRLCDAWSQRYGRDERICLESGRDSAVTHRLPKGFSYYALGDLHRSWRGVYAGSHIIYPGSPETISRDDYEETKRVFLVDITGDGVSIRDIPLKSTRPWIFIEAGDYRELLSRVNELDSRVRGYKKPPIVVIKIYRRLEKGERERITGILDQLMRDKKILAYDGPEVEELGGVLHETKDTVLKSSVGVEEAVNMVFRDQDVRSFILNEVIRGRSEGSKLLSRLLESGDLLSKLSEEPEIKRHLQSMAKGGRI